MKNLTPIYAAAAAMALGLPALAQEGDTPTTPPAETAPMEAAPPADTMPAEPMPETMPAPAEAPAAGFMVPEGYGAVTDLAGITADQIKGADLHGPDGSKIGSISDIHLGADGAIDGVITDVGGFLGIGVHTVNIGLGDVKLYRDADGRFIASTPMTAEALKALPEYTPS